jgi:nitrite reductase (NO-forming)
MSKRVLIIGLVVVVVVGVLAIWASAGGSSASAADNYRIEGAGTGHTVEVNLDAFETVQEISDGVDYNVWTFGGTAPGPVIRVNVGDTIHFTLTNKSTLGLSHSIDFHAAQTPWDKNYQPVAPGETASFDWVARFPGAFMYHCGVPPVLQHIANGMYGAIIVEPTDPVLPAAREYVLVASEFYASDKPVNGVFQGDPVKMAAATPTYVVFNGQANRYLATPLQAKPNEPIRLWVVDAGPTLDTDFHVIGALFDHVYPDGNPTNVLNGMQTWAVPPGGGAMFELSIPDAGSYPFVTHAFAYTGIGSVGVLKISNDAPPAPDSYPAIADPFDGGLTVAKGTISGAAPEPVAPGMPDGHEMTPSPTTASPVPAGQTQKVDVTLSIAKGFAPSTIKVNEGPVQINLTNSEAMPHDFTIDDLDVKITVDANGTASGTFDAPPGTYEIYCSIPGHKDAGMVGTLVVNKAMAH